MVELSDKIHLICHYFRSKSIKKLDEMTETVGYPDELMDPEKVQNYYKDVSKPSRVTVIHKTILFFL